MPGTGGAPDRDATVSTTGGQSPAALPDAEALPDAASLPEMDGAPEGPATLTELTETLFTPSCVFGRCHITSAPAGGLSFTGRRISVHHALVGAPSETVPGRIRVVAGQPEQSYLIEKITTDTPASGTRMPPNGRVPDEFVQRIRSWILAGALDD